MERHTGRDHQRRKGRALRPPSTPPTSTGTRVATPCPPRERTDADREEPDLQGGVEGRKQPEAAVNQRRHLAARRRTSAALRLRDKFRHEHEVGRGRQPPQATTNLHRAQHQAAKTFPVLSPGKVGPQHRHPVTGHRRPCRRQAGSDPADPRSPPPPSRPHA
jgi:hypothetical protein